MCLCNWLFLLSWNEFNRDLEHSNFFDSFETDTKYQKIPNSWKTDLGHYFIKLTKYNYLGIWGGVRETQRRTQSTCDARKSGALIVRYSRKKECILLFSNLLFWESFNWYNFGTTGLIQVGFSAKCTSPESWWELNQIENWKCHMFDFRLIPLDCIILCITDPFRNPHLHPQFLSQMLTFRESNILTYASVWLIP